MCQTIHTADVDEGSVVHETLDRTAYDLLRLDGREHSLFLLRAVTLEQLTARKDETALLHVDLDDLCLNRLVNVDREILHEVKLHLGGRNEAAQSHDVGDKSTLDLFGDLRLDGLALLLDDLDVLPCGHLVSFDLREAAAVIAAERLDVDINLIADLHDVACIVRRRNGKIPLGDRNFLLVANIHIRLIAGYLDNNPFDHGALLDIGHIFLFQKFLHALL